MQLAQLVGHQLGSRTVDYDDRTTILYALCAGASGAELDLIWEEQLRPLPSLATSLGLWAVEATGDLGAYDRRNSLHVGQRLQMVQPMPASGAIEMTGRVDAVWDKGKAAIVEIAVSSAYFELGYTIFLPGLGGFGGASAPAATPVDPFEPTTTAVVPTDERLALFYRLTGDRHPVHIDPATSSANGFDRPILHGLCTLAIAAHTVAQMAGINPADLAGVEARFAAPVLPGDELTVAASTGHGSVRFEVAVGDRVVLKDGRASF